MLANKKKGMNKIYVQIKRMEPYHIYIPMRKTKFYHNDEILLRNFYQVNHQPNRGMYDENEKNHIKSSKDLWNEMDYLKENQNQYYKNPKLLIEPLSP